MAGFSVIHEDWVEQDITTQPAYHAGNALGWLYRGNKQAATNHALSGRLYLAKSGWLLLSVPNALVRGVYDALAVPGVELPKAGLLNVPNVDAELLNAHISVMTADEVKSVGEDHINERGHAFCYSLGSLREIDVRGIEGISKVWVIEVSSPELSALRRTYGLSALPKDNHPFHITVAVRKKNVLYANETGKGVAEQKPFERPISRGALKAAEVQPRVRVVMPYQGKYLMETLNNSKWPQNIGKRRFMGGGVEQGETPAQAAAREMFEELGVKIKPTAFRPLGNDPREGWQHEHYLELLKHKLKPGNFNASVGSDAVVTLSHGLPAGDDYMGPDIKALLQPALKKAAEFSRSGEKLSRSGQNDLLPGGKADNVPDREISPEALAEGQKDEHEHTRNDQIAKEIAKDHLLQDPQHYKKETLMEKVTASQMPSIVRMVTGKQAASSVYANQALNLLNTRQPIRYDHTKPVFQNIQNQLSEMKRRGDFVMQTRRNHDMYMSALSPQFRHQRMLQAFRGELPQPHPVDTLIENYGDQMLSRIGGQR